MISTKSTVIAFMLLVMLLTFTDSSVLIADPTMSRMIELQSRSPYCKLHTDRGDIQRMLLAADPKKTRHVPRESVLALEAVCNEADHTQTEIQGGLGFIYPGTKWCGPGNIASSYSDVGRYADEDRCCREHDHCPNSLAPGECRRGLCNSGAVTRSHCDCDIRFRRCLQNVQTETANTMGAAFFNVVQVTCFRERRPCSIWQSGKCPLEFTKAGIYPLNITRKFLFKISDRLTFSNQVNGNEIFENDNDLLNESLNLVARSLVKETILRPAHNLIKIMKVVESMFQGNNSLGYY